MSIIINIGAGAAPASATVHQNGTTADAPAADHSLDGGSAPLALGGADGDGSDEAGAHSHATSAADAASAGAPPEWLLQAIADAGGETGTTARADDGGSASA